MDYSKLSDFEINKLVAESFFQHASSIHEVKPTYPVGVKGDKILEQAYKTFKPERFNENAVEVCFVDLCYIKDYCNNPSDAWPIIAGNKISIENRKNKTALAWVENDAPYPDENPLRAAMIVYLMLGCVR